MAHMARAISYDMENSNISYDKVFNIWSIWYGQHNMDFMIYVS